MEACGPYDGGEILARGDQFLSLSVSQFFGYSGDFAKFFRMN